MAVAVAVRRLLRVTSDDDSGYVDWYKMGIFFLECIFDGTYGYIQGIGSLSLAWRWSFSLFLGRGGDLGLCLDTEWSFGYTLSTE